MLKIFSPDVSCVQLRTANVRTGTLELEEWKLRVLRARAPTLDH